MALGPALILGALGLVGLLAAGRSSAASAPTKPAEAELPASLQRMVAEVIGALGVDSTGKVTGTPTEEAVQAATALASQLESLGFKELASKIREYAREAAAKVPPKQTNPPAPGVPAEITAVFNRLVQFERNPLILRQMAKQFRASPSGALPEVVVMAKTLEALAAQVEAQQANAATLQKVDEVLRSPGLVPQQTSAKTATPEVPVIIAPPPPTQINIPPIPVPQPEPAVKSDKERAAEAMVLNLKQVQINAGTVKAAKGKEDQMLVKRFQTAAGLKVDGKAGPGTLTAAARAGQTVMPYVMYWPVGSTSGKVMQYRADLLGVASGYKATGQLDRAQDLVNSANRERGQAGIVTAMPALGDNTLANVM